MAATPSVSSCLHGLNQGQPCRYCDSKCRNRVHLQKRLSTPNQVLPRPRSDIKQIRFSRGTTLGPHLRPGPPTFAAGSPPLFDERTRRCCPLHQSFFPLGSLRLQPRTHFFPNP